MKIEGKAAIVTGGASGLGAATARCLAEAGAKVAVFDLNMDLARGVADETGGLAISCDVSSDDGAAAAIAEAREAHGPARILVNCAGIAEAKRVVGRNGPMPLAEHRRVIEVHLIGTFNMVRLAAAEMMALNPEEGGERGVVVNTSSVAGFEGQVGAVSYAAAKAGIAGMTLPLAREFARHGIRVAAIAPGLFETPMAMGLRKEALDSMAADVPFPQRFGRPEEFARLVRQICENPMLNGEVIRLDGAFRMGMT